eukprot:gene9818-9976_t
MKAGDTVCLGGVFLPEPFTGWKALKAGLLASTYLEVMEVQQLKQSYDASLVSDEDVAAIRALGQQGGLFERLAASIAPEIYGMLDVKKVMEQQTVSIAKAGITTTLNTRTTILAAANPAFGRWNRKFDIMWLLLDEQNEENDSRLAAHIISVHQGRAPDHGPIPPKLLRAYISLARRQQPAIPPALTDYIAAHYVDARGQEAAELGDRGAYITPRTLMSILRLSQAVAKLRFDNNVIRSDIDAAIALMRASQASIEPELQRRTREDPALRDWAMKMSCAEVPMATIQELATSQANIIGESRSEIIQTTIREYENICVWTVSRDRNGNVAAVKFPDEDINA